MIRFVQNNPLPAPLQYSLESYEPLVLKPEEEKKNSNFIKMAFLHRSPNQTNNIPNMININNISNYNTQDSINKILNFDDSTQLTDTNLYDNYQPNNIYKYGNLVEHTPIPILNPAQINPMTNKVVNKLQFSKPTIRQKTFNVIKNVNVPIISIQNIQTRPQLIRCKSSKYLSPPKPQRIMNKNTISVLKGNNILVPLKIKHFSPAKIIHKNTFKSSKQVIPIPIYRKIVYLRTNFN